MTTDSATTKQWIAHAEAALAHAHDRFAHGDHPAAIAACAGALDLAPPDPATSDLRARLLLQRGHAHFISRSLDQALDDYTAATDLVPTLAEAYAYRGLIAYQTGRAVQAVHEYNAAIEHYLAQNAALTGARQALAEALLNRGNAQFQRRDFAAAVDDYAVALQLAPDMVEALIFRGVAQFQAGNDDAAAADYAAALAHPALTGQQQAQVCYNQGLVLRRNGELAAALNAYNTALAITSRDADCLMNRGNVYAEQGNLSLAIADYEAALRLNPWLDDGWTICGMARLEDGDAAGAEADFTRAISLRPDVIGLHFNRGCARLHTGDHAGAVADFSAELGMRAPGLRGRVEAREQRAEVLNNRGLAQHYLGQFDAAIDDYERSLRELRLCGGTEQTAERMASTLLNLGVAQHQRLPSLPDDASRQDAVEAGLAALQQVLSMDVDPALLAEARHHYHLLQQERRAGALA